MENIAEERRIAALPLFGGVADIKETLLRLDACFADYPAGARILSAGGRCGRFGGLLSGGAEIVKEDESGAPVTVARLGAGELFAEAFAFSGAPLAVGVSALSDCRVLWLSAEKAASDPAVAANALRILARKSLFLTERVEHLSKHTLREKVLSYLRAEARRAGKNTFSVPFGRQGLADYLGCDRSALSFVLAKFKREGVLDYHKSSFRLF